MDESYSQRGFLAIAEFADESDPVSLGLGLRPSRGGQASQSSDGDWDVLTLRCRTRH
jgi:hypothetical protein